MFDLVSFDIDHLTFDYIYYNENNMFLHKHVLAFIYTDFFPFQLEEDENIRRFLGDNLDATETFRPETPLPSTSGFGRSFSRFLWNSFPNFLYWIVQDRKFDMKKLK